MQRQVVQHLVHRGRLSRILAARPLPESAVHEHPSGEPGRRVREAVVTPAAAAPKLIVDPPIAEALAQGIFWAQYRVENVRILPVFGKGALQASPRIGHLHITVDDLPWRWADASDNNTVDIAGLPPGPHKVTITLVDTNHDPFPGQVATNAFIVPDSAKQSHAHHGK